MEVVSVRFFVEVNSRCHNTKPLELSQTQSADGRIIRLKETGRRSRRQKVKTESDLGVSAESDSLRQFQKNNRRDLR